MGFGSVNRMECEEKPYSTFRNCVETTIMLPAKRTRPSSEHFIIDDISKLFPTLIPPLSKQKPLPEPELTCKEAFVSPSKKFVTLVNPPKVHCFLLRFVVDDSVGAHDFCTKAIESEIAEKAYCFLHVSFFGVNSTELAPKIFVEAETKASNYHLLLQLIQSQFSPEPNITAYRTI